MLSTIPVPKVEAKEPVVITPSDIAILSIVQVVESPRTIEIVKVESQYDIEQKKKKEEAEKVAAEKVARATVFVQSGDESGIVEVLYADKTNNCVMWYKNQTGITRSLGAGGRSGIQGKEPRVGAGGVLKGSPHIVLIEKIEGNTITFRESNYRKNLITRRSLPTSSFLGYVYQ